MTSNLVIRLPENLKDALTARSKAEGISLNRLMVQLLSEGIGQSERTEKSGNDTALEALVLTLVSRVEALEKMVMAEDTTPTQKVSISPSTTVDTTFSTTVSTSPDTTKPEPSEESDTDRILDYLRKHGGKGTRNQISKGKRFAPGSLDAGLAELEATGLVRIEKVGTSVKVYLI